MTLTEPSPDDKPAPQPSPRTRRRAQPHQPGRDPRREARRLSLQFLHQLNVQNGANLDQLDQFLAQYATRPAAQALAHTWILGTWHHLNDIDHAIAAVSTNWQGSRINQVDRANLRLAVYQLLLCPDIPPKVVINEAVELAQEFSTRQAPAFINGVLDTIHKSSTAQTNQSETNPQ